MRLLGGSVKRSLAMACLGRSITIAKAFGLDAATRIECHFFVVHPESAWQENGRGAACNTIPM